MKDAKGHGSNSRGGGGTTPVVRLDTVGSRSRKTGYLAGAQPKTVRNALTGKVREGGSLSSAAAETIAAKKAADEGRYPTSTITDRMAAVALGQGHPKSNGVPFGYGQQAAQMNLDRARNVALPRGAENRRKS